MKVRRPFSECCRRLVPGANLHVGTGNEAARVAWLEEALGKVPAGKRILDAGAGEQRFKRFCAHLNYVSQDFAKYDGQGDRSGLQTGTWDQRNLDIICDIASIPEPDASFDAIMCIEVLEHLPGPLQALAEFSRLLRPGGCLILTAPFCSLTHFAPYHFCTGFNRYFYEHHLPDYGFEIVELAPNGNYFDYMAQEIRRMPRISERYAKMRFSPLHRVASSLLLRLLQRLSIAGNESSELLNYGYQVVARKR